MAAKNKKAREHEKDSASDEMLRKFKANPGIFIGTLVVLILVIVSFVLVPAIVPEHRRGGNSLTFGYYDKVPISYIPGNYFAQQQERISRYYQSTLDATTFQYANSTIWRQAFENTAIHVAILQEMKKSNYAVPVKTVDRQVALQFQENGRFSSALYNKMSDSARLALWRQIQDEIAKGVYFSTIFDLAKPAAEMEFIANMASNTRKFDMVSFQVDAYPESEYLSYAQENPELFKTIHLSRITVNTNEREAMQILNSITDGTSTFEDAARSQSQDAYADKGGDMGIRYIYELEQDIIDAADRDKIINLAKGELSDVIQIGSSWVFFRIEDELKNANFEDEATMAKVRAHLRNDNRGRMEDWAIAEAQKFIAYARANDFETAVINQFKEKHSFGPIPLNYGNVDLFTKIEASAVPELAGTEVNENFWKIAFSTKVNTISEPLVQGSNVLVLVPIEETKAEETDIETVTSVFSSYWLNQTMEQSLQTYFMNSSKMDNRFFDVYQTIFQY
jgi:hypothetical protein